MTKRLGRLAAGLTIGIILLLGCVYALTRAIGDQPELYEGRSLEWWHAQLKGTDLVASNHACEVFLTKIEPRLVYQMTHDTNDSQLRLTAIDYLNSLPGISIYYTRADKRRFCAGVALGDCGVLARETFPTLVQFVKGPDRAIRAPAARALGLIHEDPNRVIPVLISCLDDSQDELVLAAAESLGRFGTNSTPAIPKLLPLLKNHDKEFQMIIPGVIQKIDPVALSRSTAK
ncbi:HEAT repeat domain-containing protein [Pedosphaera parvula]|uniref:HEAT domain containing protein n=1 Tax=Pedosphaera parvula (strain Ellin514) TaxID=320771 RepID=B9XRE1_PEDPL|nr:HEAT repeat domain-containing protein [Pedosphaera parvula]EEF57575.1 HEAT domain containing protein [Pedosphaera parvula Ellin514]